MKILQPSEQLGQIVIRVPKSVQKEWVEVWREAERLRLTSNDHRRQAMTDFLEDVIKQLHKDIAEHLAQRNHKGNGVELQD